MPRATWRSRVVCGVLLLIALSAVGVIAWMPVEQKPLRPAEVLPVNVKIWCVEPLATLADSFDVTAVVEPDAIINVAAEVAGRIERLATRETAIEWRGQRIEAGSALEEGQPIEAGQPIAYLNQELLQARRERARAQFEYDEREVLRIQDLYERGSTSRTELDDARTRREISRAMLDEATRELERTTIQAPVSGILNRLPMELGEFAAPGDVVAEIVVMNPMQVVVEVPERDVNYLHLGDRVEVHLRVSDNGHRTGEITYMSEVADPETRTTRVEVRVENSDYRLRSGQIVRVRMTRRILQNVLMIPLEAVIPLEEGRVVYVVDDADRAERRRVELGLIKGRSVRVLEGLTAGDRLIVVGHRYVGPGQPVSVIEQVALNPQ